MNTTNTISADSLITLHYRMRTPNGVSLISTFGSTPATLQLGQNELLPKLEQHLVGLKSGDAQTFQFAEGEAFGPHHPELVGRIPRSEFPLDAELAPHAVMSFTGPDGNNFSGLVLELDEASALIDFNHPLAGKAVDFEVKIIGIL